MFRLDKYDLDQLKELKKLARMFRAEEEDMKREAEAYKRLERKRK